MKPILIVYATREGHTRHIAEHIGATLRANQRFVEILDAGNLPAGFTLTPYSAVIAAASLHGLKYEAEMVRFVKSNVRQLEQMPALFLSVSLSEVTVENPDASPKERAEAEAGIQRTIDAFQEATGWRPTQVSAVAGALLYSEYNFLIRFVMKRIARKAGVSTDTSRDYEFTDWPALEHLVDQWLSTRTERPAIA